MDETRKEQLDRRWQELHRQLQDLMEGKIADGDPAVLEDQIQDELEAIEQELSNPYEPRRGP